MNDAEKRESVPVVGADTPKLKRGRPKAKNPLTVDLKVRLTAEQARKLDRYCIKHKTVRAQAVRDAVLHMIDE